MLFDSLLQDISQVNLLKRSQLYKEVFHLYIFSVENRDELAKFLKSKGVDAKIHYPIPMHLQPAAKKFNFNKNDFKNAEKLVSKTMSLPVHEFITKEQITYVSHLIREFFK